VVLATSHWEPAPPPELSGKSFTRVCKTFALVLESQFCFFIGY